LAVLFSLTAFGFEPEEYAPLAVHAEHEGFDTLWLGDHVISPVGYASDYPYSATGGHGHAVETPIVDVWVAIGHLAALTTRLRLATGVLVAPLRNPFFTARAAASAQALSNGRVLLGLGAGWLREEFDAVGVPFTKRGRRLEETVSVLRKLWTGQVVQHDGDLIRFGEVQFVPRPAPSIPIMLGGLSPAALQRTARCADGWYGPVCSLNESIAARKVITSARTALGRTTPFSFHVRLTTPVEREDIVRYLEAGFDQLVVTGAKLAPRDAPIAEKLSALSRCAQIFREATG